MLKINMSQRINYPVTAPQLEIELILAFSSLRSAVFSLTRRKRGTYVSVTCLKLYLSIYWSCS